MSKSKERNGNGVKEFEFKHERRTHTLRTHLALEPYKCNGCNMPGSKKCFKCADEGCRFYLHKYCLLASKQTSKLHDLLEDCKFNFHESPPHVSAHGGDFPYCDACGLDILGFRYQCVNHHNPHDLHPTCAFLKLEKMFGGLKFQLRNDVESECMHCDERYPTEECIRFTGWKWVAKERYSTGFPFCFSGRRICYHVKCMNEKLAPGYTRKKY